MKKSTVIALSIIGGLSAIGLSLYSYFKKQVELLKQFEWRIVNLKIDTLDLNLIKGVIMFRFTSKADIEITIKQFYLNFSVNGEQVGYVEDINEFIIPARGYNDIPIEFAINPQFIVKNIVDILGYALKTKDAIITISGNATVKSGFVSATIPISCNCSVKNLDCSC